ncbi:MAG: hypothetical protein ANABAC_1093 [Anaerolineae bacterium]|jgi:apolipoprotein N-acyltransferase|nr:MAG: hypothetical protein ANABAC_1093 [Anaerolineae bacterium]
MTKRRFALLVLMVLLLAVGVMAIYPASAHSLFRQPDSRSPVYQVSGAIWQFQGLSAGEAYRVMANPLEPSGTGTQCCCTYLPCLLKKP